MPDESNKHPHNLFLLTSKLITYAHFGSCGHSKEYVGSTCNMLYNAKGQLVPEANTYHSTSPCSAKLGYHSVCHSNQVSHMFR